MFKDGIKDLKKHIFVAYKRWEYARKISDKLVPGKSIHTVEDYQMNIAVTLDEAPTSASFGANALSLACFPVHTEFKVSETNPVEYGAICFISDDMSHDYEQVEKMERRMIEIHNEKLDMEIRYWTRTTDGCQGEFKSQKTVKKLSEAPKNILNLDEDDTD